MSTFAAFDTQNYIFKVELGATTESHIGSYIMQVTLTDDNPLESYSNSYQILVYI